MLKIRICISVGFENKRKTLLAGVQIGNESHIEADHSMEVTAFMKLDKNGSGSNFKRGISLIDFARVWVVQNCMVSH